MATTWRIIPIATNPRLIPRALPIALASITCTSPYLLRSGARPFQTYRPLSEAPKDRNSELPGPPKVVRGASKVYKNADAAVKDIKSGSTILSAGEMGLIDEIDTIIEAIARRGIGSLHSLTAVSNNAGASIPGGLSALTNSGQVDRLILSFIGSNKKLEQKYLNGEIAIELCPQGTLAERMRAAGAGIPAFFTPTGVLASGDIPVRLGPAKKGSKESTVLEKGKVRELREFNGKTYALETALPGDVAIMRAWKVDESGNCVFRYTTKAFGPVMAKAAKVTIVEAENIVPTGSIDPNDVHLPGIFVDRIVPATAEKQIELRKLRDPSGKQGASKKTDDMLRRERIAERTAKELKNGYYVNLGVGLPTLAPSFLSPETKVWIQSENGILGMGAYPTEDKVDADIINAGKETVTLVPGASTFDSAESFAMIRGGHIDVSVLGALQVSATGDLANYMIPGKVFKGMGGAMDLVSNPDETKVVIATEHIAKDGSPKIVQECSLPLTGAKVVSTIITDLCVFEVDRKNGGLTLTELAPGVEVDEIFYTLPASRLHAVVPNCPTDAVCLKDEIPFYADGVNPVSLIAMRRRRRDAALIRWMSCRWKGGYGHLHISERIFVDVRRNLWIPLIPDQYTNNLAWDEKQRRCNIMRIYRPRSKSGGRKWRIECGDPVLIKAMPSPKEPDDENTPPKPEDPATPRRAQAVRRTPNGTPIRKPSGPKGRTPNSAPMRTKTGGKKPEPTLFTDFLLGRPSPSRTRRKSVDVVRAEMRQEAVNKVQQPGRVKDRVKQWQKASAAAVIEDPAAPVGETDEILVVVEEGSGGSGQKIEPLQTRPGRGKGKGRKDAAELRSKSTPRKRVVSDEHWMKKKNSPIKKDATAQNSSGDPIPKDFLKATAINPPLEKKIQDWVKRFETDGPVLERAESKPGTKETPKINEPDDGIRITPSGTNPVDDGIRVKPSSKSPMDDGIRTKPSREASVDDGIRIKTVRKANSKKPPKAAAKESDQTPKKQEEKPREPLPSPETERENRKMESTVGESQTDQDESSSWATPTRSHKSRRHRKSDTPPESMADIPFGNSAFSVLDLPVGAEANTMRKPKPQRNPSLSAVPKVLRKVYNEGLKIVHHDAEPPRTGVNQPQSIESWLNNTTEPDPFVDRPEVPEFVIDPSESVSRNPSYRADDRAERDLTRGSNEDKKETGHKEIPQDPKDQGIDDQKVKEGLESPLSPAFMNASQSNSDNVDISSPPSPAGLKRSPATRNASSPVKLARKIPLKEAVMGAFRGESGYRSKSDSKPLPDYPDLRPRENRSPSEHRSSTLQKRPVTPSSQGSVNWASNDAAQRRENVYKPSIKRVPPTTGVHRLSTIASVETFSTQSSVTGTGSELSYPTITKDTAFTGTESSYISRKRSNKSGLKRRLTKHSDLVSMLSLPDTTQPGINRSGGSLRTSRSNLDTATIRDLLRELRDDEVKYMRELKTLVDGVIPVLLTCVLSKSDSAIAAGLFNPYANNTTDRSMTKPIVDMGIALERLKSLHRRIPLEDPSALISWARGAHNTYNDYLNAWRTGFQDVVVNLAPASLEDQSVLDGMPRNEHGDVVDADGERVDVAFLLKRPLVRVKKLTGVIKGMYRLKPSELSEKVQIEYEELYIKTRRRVKEEAARMEDQAANNTDSTRARDLRTMAVIGDVQVDRTRQVAMKDYFLLYLQHSNGQRIECRAELVLRDKPSDPSDAGDVLICQVDDEQRWLLFPPVAYHLISARIGDNSCQVLIMIRGIKGHTEWRETLLLETDDPGAADDWVQKLGMEPLPPLLSQLDLQGKTQFTTKLPSGDRIGDTYEKSIPIPKVEISIAERQRMDAEENSKTQRLERRRVPSSRQASYISPSSIKEALQLSDEGRDLNEAMSKAGTASPSSRPRPARYHARHLSEPVISATDVDQSKSSGDSGSHNVKLTDGHEEKRRLPQLFSAGLPLSPKLRSTKSDPAATTGPDTDVMKNSRPLTPPSTSSSTSRDDDAPPPPVHKTPLSSPLGKTPVLDSPNLKANNRRSSSPLKHEYQPSEASETSPASEGTESDGYSSDSSSDDELETSDLPIPGAAVSILGKHLSPSPPLDNLPEESIAPSNSASQAHDEEPTRSTPVNGTKISATVSYWDMRRGQGCWKDVAEEPCTLIISPGRIEVWEMSVFHSSPNRLDPTLDSSDKNLERPLLAFDLTPRIAPRRSVAIDVEITSPPLPESRLECGKTVRFRTLTSKACHELYCAIHQASLMNAKFNKLEEERRINGYGQIQEQPDGNDRASWFGRKSSYRAQARAPVSEQSGNSPSVFSALSRFRAGSIFNIAKSYVEIAAGNTSRPTSTSSGLTSPQTMSINETTTSNAVNLGSTNLKIQIYAQDPKGRDWEPLGDAFLTVTQPPPGMKQASSLYHGLEKRIIVSQLPFNGGPTKEKYEKCAILLDVVLGSSCFSRLGTRGIVVNVWQEVTGPNGEVGMVGPIGGLSGKTRKWCLSSTKGSQARWILGLLAGGG
ncbi:hypothetical protein B7494_g1925 [Chlorociboria aeruginascens]|nr:hypothetical protein B7494_g1925 [Chlorociboria aeruginascens]